MVIGREARGLGARAAFPSGEVFRDPGFSGATAALHRSGPSSSVWRGSLRTSRQLRKRKAACAQLQLVPTDGENFRRGCAGMSATHPTLRMLFVIRPRKFV